MIKQNKISLLEKWAVSELKKLQASLRSFIYINKLTIFVLSFVIGVLATLPIVFFDNYINTLFSSSFEVDMAEFLIKWFLIILCIGLFSAIEIYLLYKITFIYFVKMKKIYNIKDEDFYETITFSFNLVMAKVALEMEENHIHELDADIFRNKSKYLKYFQIILYKVKIFLVNSIIKMALKKIFVTNGMRLTIDYISAIVIGIFDVVVMYLVIKKMKYIFQSIDDINKFFHKYEFVYNNSSVLFQEVIIRVISNIISDIGEFHPNYKYILNLLKENLNYIDIKEIENIGSFDELKEKILLLDENEKKEAYLFIDFIISINRKKTKDLKIFLFND